MINVSEAFKEAMSTPGRILKTKFVFTDKTFEGESIKDFDLEDSILTSDSFEIGTFICTSGKANLLDVDYKFAGKEFNLHLGVLCGATVEYIDLGLFRIETVSVKERITEIKFYDRATRFDIDYTTSLTYPTTLLSIAKEVCTKIGVTLASESFSNANYRVEVKPNFDEGYTCRKIISQIAELTGGYARINNIGKLEFFNLDKYGSNSTYAGDSTYTSNVDDRLVDNRCVIGIDRNTYIDLDASEGITETVSKIVVKTGDVKAELGDDSGAAYFIENNKFCQNPMALVGSLFEKLYGITYKKLSVKWIGNPMWQCGDQLTVYDGYKFNNTYIMGRKLTFNGGLTEEYEAEGKTKEEGEGNTKGNVTLKIDKTLVEVKINADNIEQRVKKDDFESYVKQTAEEISAKVSNKDFQSYVSQTAEEIKTKVSRGTDLETEVKQNAESWELSIKGKLTGKKYKFDGDGFTIGGDTGDVSKHTPSGSEYKFTDGSIARIDGDGFYRLVGTSKSEYHSLSYMKTIDLKDYPDPQGGVNKASIQLPNEYIGKDFKAMITVRELNAPQFDIYGGGWSLLGQYSYYTRYVETGILSIYSYNAWVKEGQQSVRTYNKIDLLVIA